ncbi:Membrane protein [Streptococcus pneumoniae]|nr:Membrane protein [Streptococcus pneumoniae]VSB13724.1 Membrane protein [Streptococcus pneumoniae]
MELVLPNNYVALEQEEMMYLDGGFSILRWPVATAINIVLMVF